MKRSLLLCCLFAILGIYGCQFFSKSGSSGEGSPVSPLDVEPIRRSGNASLVFTFRLPEVASATGDLHAATVNGMRVAFILKIINPGHPEEPYTQVRQDVDVVNGVASATFVNLPPNSVVGEVLISSGTYRGYSDFHGAVDLVDTASNSLEIAPMGSSEDPAQIAQVIKNMLGDTSYFGYIQPKIAAAMKTALVEGRTRVGTDSTQLLANVREAYLAMNSTTPTTMNQSLDAAKQFMTGFEVYKNRAYADQPVTTTSGSKRREAITPGGIRAAIYSWSWDPQNRVWFYLDPGYVEEGKYAYAYMTPLKDVRYQYITDNPTIDRLVTFSEYSYYYGYDLVTITDANEYGFGAGMQTGSPWFDHQGETYAKVNNQQVWKISSDLRNCHVDSKYPGLGFIRYDDVVANTRTRFIFNGTCVAKVEVTDADNRISGPFFVFLDFLGGEPPPKADPNPGPAPAYAPLNVRAVATHSNIILSWDPVPDATGYDVYWSLEPNKPLIDCGRLSYVQNPFSNQGEVGMWQPVYLRVVARSRGGESPPSAEVSVTALPPLPPSGLQVEGADGQVLLTWNKVPFPYAGEPDYYQYLVLVATQPMDLTTWETAYNMAGGKFWWAGGNQMQMNSLPNGMPLYFTVCTMGQINPESKAEAPYNRFGISGPAPQVSTTLSANGVLLPPCNVKVVPGSMQFAVSWMPNTSNEVVGYEILLDIGALRKYVEVNPYYLVLDDSGKYTWAYPGYFPKGTVASVSIRAGSYFAYSNYTSSASGTVQGPYPVTTTVAVPGDGMNTVTWTYSYENASLIDRYNLYWSTGPIAATSTATKISNVSSPYVHSGLTNGNRYYYTVTVDAQSGYGESDPSTVVCGIPRAPIIPAVPGNVTAAASASANILSWTAVDLATSYNIYWSTSSGVSKTTGTLIPGVTRPPYRHGSLTPGTRYYYVVTSVGAEGESAGSAVVSAVPQ